MSTQQGLHLDEPVCLARRRLSLALALAATGCKPVTDSEGQVHEAPRVDKVIVAIAGAASLVAHAPILTFICFLGLCLSVEELVAQGLAWYEVSQSSGAKTVVFKCSNNGVQGRIDASDGARPQFATFTTPETQEESARSIKFDPQALMAAADIKYGEVAGVLALDGALQRAIDECTRSTLDDPSHERLNGPQMRLMRSECLHQRYQTTAVADYYAIKSEHYDV